MEFSTEMVEKMAELLADEMARVIGSEGAVMAVEDGMRELLRQVGKRALGKYVSRRDAQPEAAVVCACGGRAGRLSKREAKAISVFGKIRYERQYYLCRACGQGQCPLDQRLGLDPGQVTPGLAKLIALAGVEVAFEEAGRWMEQFLLFRVSDNTIPERNRAVWPTAGPTGGELAIPQPGRAGTPAAFRSGLGGEPGGCTFDRWSDGALCRQNGGNSKALPGTRSSQ
jgi:hypothetical protein